MTTSILDHTINELCEAYLANRSDPGADRPCKHPRSLQTALVAVRREWGDWTLAAFKDGFKLRVKLKCQEWRSGKKPVAQATVRKRISTL